MWETHLKIAKEQEEKWLFWEAEETYKKALLEFNKLKGFKGEKSLCKRKIRENNLKKSKSFNSQSFQYNFSENEKFEIERFVKYIVEADNSLYLIGNHPFFFPSFLDVQKRSLDLPISFQVADLSLQDDNWDILKWWNDSQLLWFYQHYNLSQSFIIQIYLVPVFNRLIKEGKLDSNSIISYLKEKNIFTDDFISILEIAINRFFSADYTSCLHILIPKFEKVFIDLTVKFSNNRVDTISSRKQKWENEKIWIQDKTLSEDFLRDSDVVNIWGKDFCEQIIFVLFSQLWLKLRHKIAHGYSTLEDLNFQNCVLIIYFYIVIISRIKIDN